MKNYHSPVNRHNISVLFVDDNASIREVYRRLLASRVNKFYIAENGHHGLELYIKHQPDLVVTDVNMPVMDGLEMLKEIKTRFPNAKTVLMSAYNTKENFIESINLGVDGYLVKPIEAKKLLSLIDEFAGITMMKWELESKEKMRQEAEDHLKKSLEEKEVLLKEVHHRVKNNMQIISSILKMQSRNIEDPKLKGILQESQNRIHSMALIHENLYSNEGLADIEFSDYIKSLTGNIARSYASHAQVKFKFEIEDANLPMDLAIPCGLIINELISNSFKYAFIGREDGCISISFMKEENTENHSLIVKDNGVGIPDSVDIIGGKSLGLKIIKTLVKQIDGELITDFTNGTKFKINFKINFKIIK